MIIGITAEYNPFHNGHKYQVDSIRKQFPTATIVAIMSGSFTQRGELTIIDKWTRAKLAVINGVDIVFELPTIYVNRSAEFFAAGSVNLMNEMHCNAIAFGAEADNLADLQRIAEQSTDIDMQKKLHALIDNGLSYSSAVSKLFDENFSKPNNILAVEYLKANLKTGNQLQPILIHRVNSSHQDTQLNCGISSSNAIRLALKNQPDWQKLSTAVDSLTLQELKKSCEDPPNIEKLFRPLIVKILSMEKNQLQKIHGMNEGLENRLINKVNSAKSFENLIQSLITRRYTRNRITRLLVSILLDLTDEKIHTSTNYLRVLAFNDNGRKFLHEIKKLVNLPIIIKIPEYRAIISIDINATNLWSLTRNKIELQKDFLTSPIYVSK